MILTLSTADIIIVWFSTRTTCTCSLLDARSEYCTGRPV